MSKYGCKRSKRTVRFPTTALNSARSFSLNAAAPAPGFDGSILLVIMVQRSRAYFAVVMFAAFAIESHLAYLFGSYVNQDNLKCQGFHVNMYSQQSDDSS